MVMEKLAYRLLGLSIVPILLLALLQPIRVSAQAKIDICDQLQSNPSLINTFTSSEQGVIAVECANAANRNKPNPPVHITYTTDFYRTREQLRARGILPNVASPTANMTYQGGSIMQTVTAYTIYWTPNNTLANDYKNLINRYFADINASPFYNINTQYFQNPGSVFMQNSSGLGGTWTDTANSGIGNGYPGGRGTAANALTRADIENEVAAALAANPTWGPPGLTKQYLVYYEQGIEQCFNATSCTPGVPNGQPSFCAYHTYFTSGGNTVIYGNMPYDETWTTGCRSFSTSPNGNIAADAEISTSSHEHFEAATDPRLDAWYDSDLGGENGDKCAYRYGAMQADGHNMVLNGNPYIIQQEWSNADLNPSVQFSGCVTRYNANVDVAVNKTGPASVIAGTPLAYNISVTNSNPTYDATDIVLTDAIPANTTFVSLTQTAGPSFSCAVPAPGGTGTITCTRLALPANGTASFALDVNVAPSVLNGVNLANTASIATSSGDSNASNDVSTVNTTVNAVADLVIEKRATTDLAIPGIAATYALTVTNNGPSDAQNAVLTDAIPANSTFAALAQTAGTAFTCTLPSVGGIGAVGCTIATFPVGASATFTIAVQISPTNTSAITNTASIAASDNDPNLGNNTSTVTTTVSLRQYKQRVLSDLTPLFVATTDKQDKYNLHEAIEDIGDALKSKRWIDDNTLTSNAGVEVFTRERDATSTLVSLIKHNNSGLATVLPGFIRRLVAVDRGLADIALNQAISASGRPNRIVQAQQQMAQGDTSAGAAKYTSAIGHYKNAWQHAQAAMKK